MENEVLNGLADIILEGFTIKHKPCYSLKECLELIDENCLDMIIASIYLNNNEELEESKFEKLKKAEKIKIACTKLPETFREVGALSENIQELKKIKKNKPTNFFDKKLAILGFMYIFEEKKKKVYVMPNELIDCLNSMSKEEINKQIEEKYIENILSDEILLYGYMKKESLANEFKKKFQKDLEESAYQVLKDVPVKDNCYIKPLLNEREDLFKKIIKEKKTLYTEEEKSLYLNKINQYLFLLTIEIKNQNQDYSHLLFEFSAYDKTVEEVLKTIKKETKLEKNQEENVKELLKIASGFVKRWSLGGRSQNDVKTEEYLKKYSFKSNSNIFSLEDCLNASSDERIESLYELYHVSNIEDLMTKIIDSFEKDYEKEYLKNELESMVGYYDFEEEKIYAYCLEKGYLFSFKEKGSYHAIYPFELDSYLIEKMYEEEEGSIEEIIENYLSMNGVIQKEELSELLDEYHGYEVTIEELDEIVDEMEMTIFKVKNCYSLIDMEEHGIEHFLEEKDNFEYTKIYDMNDQDYIEDIIWDLEDFGKENNKTEEETNFIISFVLHILQMNMYKEDLFFTVLKEDQNIILTKKEQKELSKIINFYKNDIPLWFYNGYSKNELKDFE